MNDTELLRWIAEHMLKFDLGLGDARMEYLDNDGYNHVVQFNSEELDPQDLDMLKGCIAAAMKETETKQ